MNARAVNQVSDLVEAHRGKDLEVPLFELEQRVEKIEKWS